MDPNTQYRITAGVPGQAKTLVLRRIEWKMLFALATPKAGAELPNRFGITFDRCSDVLNRLMEMGLVEGHGYSAGAASHAVAEFNPAPITGSPVPGPISPIMPRVTPLAPAPPFGIPAAPPPPPFAPPPPPPPPAPVAPGLTLAPPMPPPLPPEALRQAAYEAELEADEEDAPTQHGIRLKPIIDFIQSSAGSGTLGQLTVYRVFLKIPPNLLKEAKIQSVKFVDDNFRIDSVELQGAIRDAVKKTLKMDVPYELLPS